MCFSATGSFVVSGLLAGIGGASLVNNKSPEHRMFAAVPLLFAGQQVCEGLVWLTITHGGDITLQRLAVAAFLAFALVVWPVWFPFCLLLVEPQQSRRTWLKALFVSGMAVAGYAAWVLGTMRPTAVVAGHSIQYGLGAPHTMHAALYVAVYLIPVAAPFFVSSEPLSRTTGFVLLGSMLATVVLQRNALTSVWCFFAAILSGIIYTTILKKSRRLALQSAPALV